MIISSRSNPRVKQLIKERDRYFFFEGEKLVKDILSRGIGVAILIVNEAQSDRLKTWQTSAIKEIWYVAAAVLAKISLLKEKPHFIAVVEMQEKLVDFSNSQVVIGLDGIQDPGNVGTVFRCAAAFGVDGIGLSGSSVKLTNGKFLRAAQDSFFSIAWQRFAEAGEMIRKAESSGMNIYITSSHGGNRVVLPHELRQPCMVLFGNEGQGLENGLFSRYPVVRIPQVGKMESLNVGISAGIIMYELSRL